MITLSTVTRTQAQATVVSRDLKPASVPALSQRVSRNPRLLNPLRVGALETLIVVFKQTHKVPFK